MRYAASECWVTENSSTPVARSPRPDSGAPFAVAVGLGEDERMADRSVFEEVADALRGAVSQTGELRCSYHRYGIKVWVGSSPKAPREHYEAQVVGRQHAPEATTLAIEVGFHTEYADAAENDEVMSALVRAERSWRKQLGKDPFVGDFLGRPGGWQRVSEVWPDPDLSDPELVFELAARLTEYVTALEPYRTGPRQTADK